MEPKLSDDPVSPVAPAATAGLDKTAAEPASTPEEDELKGVASPRFPVVGIGASAGGLEALEGLLRRLASDAMAFIVVQHLAPGHESVLTEILSRATSMRVVTVHEGIKVETGTIYVTPPDVEISIAQGVLHAVQASNRVPRHTIDAFFRTLAADLGPLAIGVILSGAGTDGMLGLRAIMEAGGICFVQEPSTAAHASMPQAAIDGGYADYCLSPGEIRDELMRLSGHSYVAKRRPPHVFSQETLAQLFEKLRRAFGVDFSGYKLATVERRIQRRMALHKFEKLDDYLKSIATNSHELSALYGDLLIGVTSFFRDREAFEALKSLVFPRLLEKRSTEVPIRIWIPGCSTGEEAFSIAMCLLEYLDSRPGGHKIQIFGTDIDEQALIRARQAVYPQSIELDISPDRLQRFFSYHDHGYQVSRQIRDMVVFARHNLGKDPPFSHLDLISCRNVLIYMQSPLQRKVLRVFHYALKSDAFLLLGTSESVGDAADQFSLWDRKLKIYSKKNIPSSSVFDFSLGMPSGAEESSRPGMPPLQTERRPMFSLQQLADRKVLEKFGPPGVLIDENMEVLQFRGQIGPFLGPSPGAATLNVLKLVRPELLVELRTAVSKVTSDGLPKSSEPVHLWADRDHASVVVEVIPLQESGAARKCLLVLFHQTTPSTTSEQAERAREELRLREPRVEEIERELLLAKEYLQTTVQELEGANEELQSSNEELQSSNEELQSANEELETSKEELQSTNEELATVNEELQNRMTQLALSNDDLQNILCSISCPLLIVGMDLRIRRFSAAAEKLLNLISSDVGRPVGYLGPALNAPQLEAIVSETINSVRERGQRVRCSDGLWYTMTMIPYRTADHAIRGALIEFLRAPAGKKGIEKPEVHEFVAKVLSTLPHVLMLLDEHLGLIWVNKAFFEMFPVRAEILGLPLDEVWEGRATEPALWAALEKAVVGGGPFAGIVVRHPFGRKSNRPVKFGGRYLPAEGDRPALTLVIMEEITEQEGTV
jgi:two-component system CheB/CheR fusion protein